MRIRGTIEDTLGYLSSTRGGNSVEGNQSTVGPRGYTWSWRAADLSDSTQHWEMLGASGLRSVKSTERNAVGPLVHSAPRRCASARIGHGSGVETRSRSCCCLRAVLLWAEITTTCWPRLTLVSIPGAVRNLAGCADVLLPQFQLSSIFPHSSQISSSAYASERRAVQLYEPPSGGARQDQETGLHPIGAAGGQRGRPASKPPAPLGATLTRRLRRTLLLWPPGRVGSPPAPAGRAALAVSHAAHGARSVPRGRSPSSAALQVACPPARTPSCRPPCAKAGALSAARRLTDPRTAVRRCPCFPPPVRPPSLDRLEGHAVARVPTNSQRTLAPVPFKAAVAKGSPLAAAGPNGRLLPCLACVQQRSGSPRLLPRTAAAPSPRHCLLTGGARRTPPPEGPPPPDTKQA